MSEMLLDVRDLTVEFPTDDGIVKAVQGVSFFVARGETLGIVGESGSGKSATFQAIMGLLSPGQAVVTGHAVFDNVDLTRLAPAEIRRYRGARLSMIFQDPLSALNPVQRVGRQIAEVLQAHESISANQARTKVAELLHLVGLPRPEQAARQWPHEFSGGMRQRVMIAMALAMSPDLVIADEATTALDVTVQAQVLELIQRLKAELGMSVVMITHDLGVVAAHCDRVMIMYAGRIVETGSPGDIYEHSAHPYTWGLMQSATSIDKPRGDRLQPIEGQPPSLLRPPAGCAFHPRCPHAVMQLCASDVPLLLPRNLGHSAACHLTEPGPAAIGMPPRLAPAPAIALSPMDVASEPLLRIRNVSKTFHLARGHRLRSAAASIRAVDGVDLDVYTGETLGVVGESGCGKSTLARLILRLHDATSGAIEFAGKDITSARGRGLRQFRRDVQMIFQDPYGSLNPRKTVGSIIGEQLRIHATVPRQRIRAEVRDLMTKVGLNPEHVNRHPHAFSGGQRQRIGIARALALHPRLVVADEPVSALDVSIQAQILNLMQDLQRDFDLTFVFIAHDLSVVKQIADRVAVMYLGKIVEIGSGETFFTSPRHPYTAALMSAVPVPDPAQASARNRIRLHGDVPSPAEPPTGCRFHTRCPWARLPKCSTIEPTLEGDRDGRFVACHFPLDRDAPTTPDDHPDVPVSIRPPRRSLHA